VTAESQSLVDEEDSNAVGWETPVKSESDIAEAIWRITVTTLPRFLAGGGVIGVQLRILRSNLAKPFLSGCSVGNNFEG
jgi:hypothetical protein